MKFNYQVMKYVKPPHFTYLLRARPQLRNDFYTSKKRIFFSYLLGSLTQM